MVPIGLLRMLPPLSLIASLAALILLAAAQPTEASPVAQQVVISMNDDANAFVPAEVAVPAGTTVSWVTNQGPFIHSVTSDSGLFDSGFIYNGQSFSVTFDTPGTYGYVCTPHQALGMAGIVQVR